MQVVSRGVDAGVEQAVADLGMEREYERAVLSVVRDGLRGVAEQFEAYFQAGAGLISGGGNNGNGKGSGADETAGWTPEIFEEAVCCMEGMDCFDGDFANAAGRGAIIEELAWREADLEEQKKKFDTLNALKEREASDARTLELADMRLSAGKLFNKIE